MDLSGGPGAQLRDEEVELVPMAENSEHQMHDQVPVFWLETGLLNNGGQKGGNGAPGTAESAQRFNGCVACVGGHRLVIMISGNGWKTESWITV
ncbi:hypothetical protein DPPLL_37860 [Desulfofustis limnaeus]|uniref:Uncharacterized protein n=1 Tax=Desulfofustis limnaeus TaxID=2740163 RepID=A0ABN6MC41_9BACT|nr:hypothetical protein DPPLL_37860 [Desulfofustis limnaeus]